MRATAILMVLSSHSLWIYPENNSFFAQVLKLFGFLGVEIFFVLSGFLIGGILYEKFVMQDFTLKSVLDFLKRRWFRTLPNYYLILAVNIFIAFLIGYAVDGLWKYFFFLQNFYEPLAFFFNESWSLSVEEWAYFLFPILLLLLSKTTFFQKKYVFLLLAVFLILFFQAAKMAYDFQTANTAISEWNSSLKSVVVYRIDAVMYGVLARWIYINCLEKCTKYKIHLAYLGALGLFVLYFGQSFFITSDADQQFFYNVALLPANSILLCLFFPFLYDFKFGNSVLKKVVVYVSVISYSLYLVHYGVVLQLMKFYFPTEIYDEAALHLYTFFYFALTFSVSSLLYMFYEKPITDLREKRRRDA